MELTENIVVVGGAGGIGSAIVKLYASLGKCVIIGDINEEASKKLSSDAKNIHYIYVDVNNPTSIQEFARNIQSKYKVIHHLVSLAGGCTDKDKEYEGLKGLNTQIIDESIRYNLNSHLHLTKELTPLMTESSNKTVTFISSINALQDYTLPAYSAAKAGILGIVNSTVVELGKKGIRINTVLPGTVPTPNKPPKDFDAYLKGTVLNRFATPEEIANTVYALTHLMTCITGQSIVADCGQTKKSFIYK